MALSSRVQDWQLESLVAAGAAGEGEAATTALRNFNDDCKVSFYPSLRRFRRSVTLTSVERLVRLLCCRVSRFP